MSSDFATPSEKNSFKISFKAFPERHFFVDASQLAKISLYWQKLASGNFKEKNEIVFEPYDPAVGLEGDDPDDVLRVFECMLLTNENYPVIKSGQALASFFRSFQEKTCICR
jgi:hypothetical protein